MNNYKNYNHDLAIAEAEERFKLSCLNSELLNKIIEWQPYIEKTNGQMPEHMKTRINEEIAEILIRNYEKKYGPPSYLMQTRIDEIKRRHKYMKERIEKEIKESENIQCQKNQLDYQI